MQNDSFKIIVCDMTPKEKKEDNKSEQEENKKAHKNEFKTQKSEIKTIVDTQADVDSLKIDSLPTASVSHQTGNGYPLSLIHI